MDFNAATFNQLDEHAMQIIIEGTEELSPILNGHLFVEKILEALISKHLTHPEVFFKKQRSFDLKLDLARAMNLLPEIYYSAFRNLNKIRNNYSHVADYRVTMEELNGLRCNWEELQDLAYKTIASANPAKAATLAVIFVCWKAILLIKEPEQKGNQEE